MLVTEPTGLVFKADYHDMFATLPSHGLRRLMGGQRRSNPLRDLAHRLGRALAFILAGVLRLAKPYAGLDAMCLAEALIDYYLLTKDLSC